MVLLAAAERLRPYPSVENRRYLKALNNEINKVKPQAALAAKLEKDAATARQRTILLDQLRKRSKQDIDVLAELTRVLPPPIWLNNLEVTRNQVSVAGEADQATPLLKQIDASPFFEASEFTMQPLRIATGEAFRVRTMREAGK